MKIDIIQPTVSIENDIPKDFGFTIDFGNCFLKKIISETWMELYDHFVWNQWRKGNNDFLLENLYLEHSANDFC